MRKAIDRKEIISGYFVAHYDQLHSLCCRVFKNRAAAEDALHTLYEKLVKNAGLVEFPKDEVERRAYMYSAIRNQYRDEQDKGKLRNCWIEEEEEEALSAEDETPSHDLPLDEVDSYMQQHSHLFTEDQRNLWNCMVEGCTIPEIEQRLGKNRNTLYVMRHLLLIRIRSYLAQDGWI